MKIYVKPRQGFVIVHSETYRILAAEGDYVDDSDHFWIKRLVDGDVTVSQPTPVEPIVVQTVSDIVVPAVVQTVETSVVATVETAVKPTV